MSARPRDVLDFDEEARKLHARLNLDVRAPTREWRHADAIYKHPTGKGIIYVGNQSIAENYTLLKYCLFQYY